ncbi:MAG TPA: hypothetical protein VEQ85_07435 [Lacipirellulaceae bacterium]|nr:hypothetical protein [Lacipirellulaceae bacterium]
MPRTLGYHLVKSAFGQWLPGDQRGHWSTAWDEEIGYVAPHPLHAGDPVRKRMAEERMKHPPTVLTPPMTAAIADAAGRASANQIGESQQRPSNRRICTC